MDSDDTRWRLVCPPRGDLVRPVRVDPTGRSGPTPGQARGPHWRRTSRGCYVPAHVDATDPEQRILEASMRLVEGAVTGWAACRMHGAAFFDGLAPDGRTLLPVPLSCSPLHTMRKGPGDDLVRDQLFSPELVELEGVRCTAAPRAVFDAVRRSQGVRSAVVAMDMALAADIVTRAEMVDYVGAHSGWTGVGRARAAVALADGASRSPQESRLRLVWQLDAGRGTPLVNRAVFDRSGRLLGYPDLLDPVAGVVGEYDGEHHRDARRHSADVDREAAFRDHGLEVVRVTGADLRRADGVVIARLDAAYRRAEARPAAQRTWTLTPPPWWGRGGLRHLPATG